MKENNIRWKCFPFFIIVVFYFGCESSSKISLAKIYSRAAMEKQKNPVILIHGIGGAQLRQKKNDQLVWGAFTATNINVDSAEGIRALALPIWNTDESLRATNISDLEDDIYASAPLEKVDFTILGLPFSVQVYQSILQTLGIGGYYDSIADIGKINYGREHYTCFTFFYDWRKDNVSNVKEFAKFLQETTKYVKKKDKEHQVLRKDLRFDVVAHSMGGLIARYYLQYGDEDVCAQKNPEVTWAGAKHISRLIQIGTPNTGSIDSLISLLKGVQYSFLLPQFPSALMSTFPSLYQLLPRSHHKIFIDKSGKNVPINIYDVDTWEKNQWGIFAEDQKSFVKMLLPDVEDRYAIVRQYVKAALERAEAFHRALDVKAKIPCPTQIILYASNSVPTPNKALTVIENNKFKFVFDKEELQAPGDGVVTIANAVGDSQQKNENSLWQSNIPFSYISISEGTHIGITKSFNFQNNLLNILLKSSPPNERVQNLGEATESGNPTFD